MSEHFDAVVIGGGLGGLSAGVALAGGGMRVLVLEHHTLPGGYAQSFTRGPFRFDTSLHALVGLAPGGGTDELLRQLGVRERVTFHRLDPLYVARYPGLEVRAPADTFAYEAELIRAFRDEHDGICSYVDEARAVVVEMHRLDRDPERDRLPLDALLRRYPHLAQVGGETWETMFGRHVRDPRLRGVLGSLWGYGGLPPSSLSALFGCGLFGYHDHGGWYPEGSASAVSYALESELRGRGGEIRYGQRVTEVRIDHERAVGVSTSHGLVIDADLVISNASAPSTMLELVGREHLPGDYVKRVETPTPSYTTFAVYLGLDRDLCGEQGLPHELFINSTYDHDESYRASLQGEWGTAGLSITDYTRVDPGCAPQGGGVIVITGTAAWDYDNVWGTGGDLRGYHDMPSYQAIKGRVADAFVARAAEHVDGLRDAIRFQEASTPLTNHAYTLNPKGAIEGYENSVANSGPGWLPQQTPIRNLVLAGAWTNTGGQVGAMRSGLDAANIAFATLAHTGS